MTAKIRISMKRKMFLGKTTEGIENEKGRKAGMRSPARSMNVTSAQTPQGSRGDEDHLRAV